MSCRMLQQKYCLITSNTGPPTVTGPTPGTDPDRRLLNVISHPWPLITGSNVFSIFGHILCFPMTCCKHYRFGQRYIDLRCYVGTMFYVNGYYIKNGGALRKHRMKRNTYSLLRSQTLVDVQFKFIFSFSVLIDDLELSQ